MDVDKDGLVRPDELLQILRAIPLTLPDGACMDEAWLWALYRHTALCMHTLRAKVWRTQSCCRPSLVCVHESVCRACVRMHACKCVSVHLRVYIRVCGCGCVGRCVCETWTCRSFPLDLLLLWQQQQQQQKACRSTSTRVSNSCACTRVHKNTHTHVHTHTHMCVHMHAPRRHGVPTGLRCPHHKWRPCLVQEARMGSSSRERSPGTLLCH